MFDQSFEIEEIIQTFEEEDRNGFRLELNLVSWRGRKAKYDLRRWNQDHTQMTKGITLNKEEMMKIATAALEHIKNVEEKTL